MLFVCPLRTTFTPVTLRIYAVRDMGYPWFVSLCSLLHVVDKVEDCCPPFVLFNVFLSAFYDRSTVKLRMIGNSSRTYRLWHIYPPHVSRDTHIDINETAALRILMPPEEKIKQEKEETRSRFPIALDRLGGETSGGWTDVLYRPRDAWNYVDETYYSRFTLRSFYSNANSASK